MILRLQGFQCSLWVLEFQQVPWNQKVQEGLGYQLHPQDLSILGLRLILCYQFLLPHLMVHWHLELPPNLQGLLIHLHLEHQPDHQVLVNRRTQLDLWNQVLLLVLCYQRHQQIQKDLLNLGHLVDQWHHQCLWHLELLLSHQDQVHHLDQLYLLAPCFLQDQLHHLVLWHQGRLCFHWLQSDPVVLLFQ